jgi:hypothetical protein
MTFRVGQPVVCIRATEDLVENRIYTIRWIGIWGCGDACCPPAECVRLAEVHRGPDTKEPWNPNWFDMPFRSYRFRPLLKRKTDISSLNALLVPGAKITEPA